MEEKRLLKKKQRAKEDGNLEQLSHNCRLLGELYRKNGKLKDALLQYNEEEKVNEALGNAIAVAVANRMIGEIYCEQGEFEEALKYQDKHLEIAKMENNAIEEQRALATIGRTYFCMAESFTSSRQHEYKSSLSSAKKAYNQSLEVCESLKGIGLVEQMEMRSRLLMNIGLVLECQGDLSRAIEYIEKAIQIGKQHELWEDICRCYSSIGMVYHRSGDHTRALGNLNLALDVAERLDSRVRSTCEILLSKAEVLFQMADFGGAKKVLLKAYRLRTPDERDREIIERNLRIAASLCQTEESVLFTAENDYTKLKSLYEMLGDGSAAVQNYKKAIEYYLKMLMCAEKAGESGRGLCPIYVSLSQTYKDDGEYDLALKYSKKELELWLDVPLEACKTSLSMAEILELKKAPYIETAGAYMKAKDFALKAQDWKLLNTTLQGLQAFQRNWGLDDLADETEKELKEFCQTHSIGSSSEDEEGNEEDSEEIGAYINLAELSESNSEEEEGNGLRDGNCRHSRLRATSKRLAVRRNEKGETALHRACITGNISLVRNLIDRGHPINIRDHCGWMPLHEACNHGFGEIVSLLIEKGAQVNDRGGTHCGGVTPIHDAASCGHLSIIKILLAAGASVFARTDKGETPLDCLMNWYRRVENDMDHYTKEEFHSVEKLLRKDLEKVGQEISTHPRAKERKKSNKSETMASQRSIRAEKEKSKDIIAKKGSRRGSGENLNPWVNSDNFNSMLSSSDDETIVSRNNHSSSDEDVCKRIPSKVISRDNQRHLPVAINVRQGGESSTSEYAKTIASLKNRQSLLSLNNPEKQKAQLSPERGPLLDPGEVYVDDWLEEDLGHMRPSKRTKRSECSVTERSLSLGKGSKNLPSRTINTNVPEESSEEVPEDSSEAYSYTIDDSTQAQMDDIVVTPKESPTPAPAVSCISNSYHQFTACTQPNLLLVNVEVEGTLLLVPLSSVEVATFESLAKEVSKRYFEFKGVRVEITLHTKGGALLSKNDPISLLSLMDESNKTLVARVTSLELPPISQSYLDACSACKVVSNPLVKQALEASQMTHALCLDDFYLKPRNFDPVLKAISHRYQSIRCLSLCGNEIGDRGAKMLSECLTSMSSLLTLDLSSNNITAVGMSEFASIFSSRSGAMHNPPLQMLSELKLAHNPLRDRAISYLVTFLNGLMSLTSLSLRDCNLTFFGLDRYDDPHTLCLESIDRLDLSYNFLGAEGVTAFLRCLKPSKVKVLNVGHTLSRHHRRSSQGVRKIAREVALFLDQDEFSQPKNLTELDLSQNQVTDSDFIEVLRGLGGATHLEKLNLECNSDLTSLTLRRLLQQSTWPNLKLDLGGCPKIFDYVENDLSFVTWMDHLISKKSFLPKAINLSVGENVSRSAVEKMIIMWNKALGSDTFVEQEMFGFLKLGVKTK